MKLRYDTCVHGELLHQSSLSASFPMLGCSAGAHVVRRTTLQPGSQPDANVHVEPLRASHSDDDDGEY
jgi:predicted Zn-dependent protease with MMP-like domain